MSIFPSVYLVLDYYEYTYIILVLDEWELKHLPSIQTT